MSKEHPMTTEAKAMAMKAGVSGDYYLASADIWCAVAVNPDTRECIVLGWYDGAIKRQSPDEALRFSMELWGQFIRAPGFSTPPAPEDG